jgi:hypothetical protein
MTADPCEAQLASVRRREIMPDLARLAFPFNN